MRTAVDLFSGIGGFCSAAHANGIETACFVEKDKRCRQFLARAWPGVPQYDDIKTFPAERYRGVDFTLAGPPCQPVSCAGKRRGKDDDRWLWDETLRVIETIRPRWALLENPPAIRTMGLDGILSTLESFGYTTGTVSIPACAVGAPHRRERYWIMAHRREPAGEWGARGVLAAQAERSGEGKQDGDMPVGSEPDIEGGLAHGDGEKGFWSDAVWLPCADGKVRRAIGDSQRMAHGLPMELSEALGTEGRQTPKDCSVTMHLLGALGNAIVPQVASAIIAAMIASEDELDMPEVR